jgi:hypothetical protein
MNNWKMYQFVLLAASSEYIVLTVDLGQAINSTEMGRAIHDT